MKKKLNTAGLQNDLAEAKFFTDKKPTSNNSKHSSTLSPINDRTNKNEAKSVQVHKTTSRGVGEYTKPQEDKTTKPQVDKNTSDYIKGAQKGKTTSTQKDLPADTQIGKYTTHLRPQTVKEIKLQAVLRDKKDYEIVQEALDSYLKK